MSTTTDVLSLFKYDPVADADSTFNITQALNNNWDKLDAAILLAIAAAGAYNPEESYAVGDYCTYKGKLRKCSTAIPTGEAWTEAHWTTTTVAAEMQELSSQLSNAVRVNPGYGNGMLGNDLNNWKRLGTFEAIGNNPDPVTTNAPPDTDSWGVVTVLSANNTSTAPAIQLFNPLNHISGGTRPLYYRFFRDVWTEWRKLAFATPPQEFDLPLAEGLQPVPAYGSNKYRKNQFNEVGITISVTKTDMGTNDIENTSLLATLPAGFRPATMISGAAFVDRGAESVVYPAFILIYPDGSVRINQSNDVSCSIVIASMSFLAAD